MHAKFTQSGHGTRLCLLQLATPHTFKVVNNGLQCMLSVLPRISQLE